MQGITEASAISGNRLVQLMNYYVLVVAFCEYKFSFFSDVLMYLCSVTKRRCTVVLSCFSPCSLVGLCVLFCVACLHTASCVLIVTSEIH